MTSSKWENKIFQVEAVLIIFSYIFSFTILGPINSSMFIALLLFKVYNKRYNKFFLSTINSRYSKILLSFLFILITISIAVAVIQLSFDFQFTKIFILLFLQYILGCIVWSFLKYKESTGYSINLNRTIIFAFILQSLIQCVVSVTPSLLPIIYYFNNAQALNESYTELFGVGVRGVAMANGTGFSLSLGYGIAFIIYIKEVLATGTSFRNLIYGLLIFIGIFFAGRSGFIGVGIGCIYYFICPSGPSLMKKIKKIFSLLLSIATICVIIFFILPQFSNHIINNVLPFAFEPIYNFINNDSFESASTNDLGNMWQTELSDKEIIIGEGYYFEPGKDYYYKRVDIGLYKNLFFWGAGGYILMIVFQYLQLYPLRYKKIEKNELIFFLSIFLFLWILDFKAISLALNKTAFSIIILLVLNYETNSIHYSLSSINDRSRSQLYKTITRRSC